MSGSVYVRMTPADQTLSARQQTFEYPNGIVVFDFDDNGRLLGVEVLDAVQVDWNGKPMLLPGGGE